MAYNESFTATEKKNLFKVANVLGEDGNSNYKNGYVVFCTICPLALAFNDSLHQISICGNDIKGIEQETAGVEWPLLFLIAWVFIMKMQFHSIRCLAQPQVRV